MDRGLQLPRSLLQDAPIQRQLLRKKWNESIQIYSEWIDGAGSDSKLVQWYRCCWIILCEQHCSKASERLQESDLAISQRNRVRWFLHLCKSHNLHSGLLRRHPVLVSRRTLHLCRGEHSNEPLRLAKKGHPSAPDWKQCGSQKQLTHIQKLLSNSKDWKKWGLLQLPKRDCSKAEAQKSFDKHIWITDLQEFKEHIKANTKLKKRQPKRAKLLVSPRQYRWVRWQSFEDDASFKEYI